MIQARTQTAKYWGSDFSITESDIEQIYNHFLEAARPQSTREIARIVIAHRIAEERSSIQRRLAGRIIYQPQKSYQVGDELVFPALQFAHGRVEDVRAGYNPQYGQFNVIAVDVNGRAREFAADLAMDHPLNADGDNGLAQLLDSDPAVLDELYGDLVEAKVEEALQAHSGFIRLAGKWFVQALMAEVNIGHLHLAEAVLEVNEGGPLPTEEVLPHLDMDPGLNEEVQRFSLNHALLNDDRFDEVAPKGKISWFLRRLEPEGVKETPGRLLYKPIPYDEALLSPQLLLLERELDDEWSNLESAASLQPVVFTLLFPHRWAGTIPLSSRIRPLFPPSSSPRQRVLLVDDETNEEIVGWVVQEGRYIYGLGDWYEKHGIPIGGFVHLKPGPEPGIVFIGYDRRRPQREWVRLATVVDNHIHFELLRRSIGCGYDDLLIVGTDTVAAVDALWRRADTQRRTVASLLAEVFPALARLNPQNTVHAKTLYSAINMLRRMPPGPVFAELVRHPAFQPVGDHYWQFDQNRWQDSS